MRQKQVLGVLSGLIVAWGLATAETKPNLNGVWKMDPAKSDFGGGPVSESRIDRLTIDGANVKDTITQKLRNTGESTYDMIYTLDGKESSNHVRGNLVKSTARWEGDELVIDSRVYALRQAQIEDRWALSPDGKTITLKRHMTGARNADQTIVLVRQ